VPEFTVAKQKMNTFMLNALLSNLNSAIV